MRDYIRLTLNNQPLAITGDDAFLTLSDYLRRRRNLTGTKVVCAEGDCGSCTILLSTPSQPKFRPVCSCILFCFQLDDAHVLTVEALSDDSALSPLQQSMTTNHGAQCGFCTPGFIATMHALLQDHDHPTRATTTRALVGNLCRCTGYDPILAAASQTPRLPPLSERFPTPQPSTDDILITTPTHAFFKPRDLPSALRFRAQNPACAVIAGATDLGVTHNKRTRPITTALSLAHLENSISLDPTHLHTSIATTLTHLESIAEQHHPELATYLSLFGSPLIKNSATLAGNLVTGSPIGDMLPPLMAQGATVTLSSLTTTRTLPLTDFYTGYRATVLANDELLTAVHIPLPKPNEIFRLYKVSRRRDLDISTFSAALRLTLTDNTITSAKIFYGGVAATILRITAAEQVLLHNPPTEVLFAQAARAAAAQVTPLTDVRASALYRRTLAHNILLKFFHDAFAGYNGNPHLTGAPTRA